MKPAIVPKPSVDSPLKRRIDLSKIVKGKIDAALRVLLYGVEGVGKSSWASQAPDPVYLCAESGTERLDVARLPLPDGVRAWTWGLVRESVRVLGESEHGYKTFVVDTLDTIEPLLWAHICERDGKASIEAYGFGKGYIAALDEWRSWLADLERLRHERGMNIVFIAHSYVKPFKNPEGEDYDRYELKLNIKAGGLVKEWVDDVLFAHYETFAVKEDDKSGKAKGVSTGQRVVETVRTAAWDAKNRHSLPASLPLDYEAFAVAVGLARPADPADLRASIAEKIAQLPEDKQARVTADLEKAGEDAIELSKINNKLSVTLSARKGA
jgi:hypothetical protein